MQIGTYPPRSIGPDNVSMHLSFATTTTPGSLTRSAINAPQGLGNSVVTYAATGIYTIALPFGSTFPKDPVAIHFQKQGAVLVTDWFDILIVGTPTQVNGILTVTLQCHRSGIAFAPAATAGNAIRMTLVGANNTGG